MKKLNYNPFSEEAPRRNQDSVASSLHQKTAVEELEEGPPKVTSLVHKGYGGITVMYANTGTEAALRVLNFLVEHRQGLGDTLAEYGLVLLQLKEFPESGFCIRRTDDGWTMAVPLATDRGQALLQIIQALLAVARGPYGAELRRARITPFRE